MLMKPIKPRHMSGIIEKKIKLPKNFIFDGGMIGKIEIDDDSSVMVVISGHYDKKIKGKNK